MNRRDWLLLFLSLDTPENRSLDPIRIMKGLFLTSQEDGIELGYTFEPYHYGPCSFDVYKDLNQLVAEGLVEEIPVPGQTWNLYAPTSSGVERAKSLEVPQSAIEKLSNQRNKVISLSFLKLLQFVYQKYPQFAKNSVFTVSK